MPRNYAGDHFASKKRGLPSSPSPQGEGENLSPAGLRPTRDDTGTRLSHYPLADHRAVMHPCATALACATFHFACKIGGTQMARGRAAKWAVWTGIPLLLIAAMVVFWDWDWFIPLVAARASAELGRPVSIQHLHLQPGRVTRVVADGIAISNPPDWDGPPFMTVKQLVTDVDVWDDIFHHQLIIPLVALDQPQVDVTQAPDGKTNYELQFAGGSSGGDTK